MNSTTSRSILRWQTIAIAFGGVAFSLLLLIVADNLDPQQLRLTWIIPLLENIGTTIMVAVTVGIILEYTSRREMLKLVDETKSTVSDQIRMMSTLNEFGLVDLYADVNQYSFTELILNSNEFVAVMNDGKRWVGGNISVLRRRLLIPGLNTIFVLQHPQSKMMDVLSDKVEAPVEFIRHKTNDTIRLLNSLEIAPTHKLLILGHHYFNVHSVFLTEEYVTLTPYLITPGRNTTPAYIFQNRGKESQYQILYDDVYRLLEVAEPITLGPTSTQLKTENTLN